MKYMRIVIFAMIIINMQTVHGTKYRQELYIEPYLTLLTIEDKYLDDIRQSEKNILLFAFKGSNPEAESDYYKFIEAVRRIYIDLYNGMIRIIDCDKRPDVGHRFGLTNRAKVFILLKDGTTLNFPEYSIDRDVLKKWFVDSFMGRIALETVESMSEVYKMMNENINGALVYYGSMKVVTYSLLMVSCRIPAMRIVVASKEFSKNKNGELVFYLKKKGEEGFISAEYHDVIEPDKILAFVLEFIDPSFSPVNLDNSSGQEIYNEEHTLHIILLYDRRTDANHHFKTVQDMYEGQLGFFSCYTQLNPCKKLAQTLDAPHLPAIRLVSEEKEGPRQKYHDVINSLRLIRFIEEHALPFYTKPADNK